ncbi:MAG TPA: histidine phosphatase family protein [Aestuariivirgaceae bacterium]|nr:histidine phosphatase family protein [Aestuariivirgaceae bacterium]
MISQRFDRVLRLGFTALILVAIGVLPTQAQELSGLALVEALRGGGFNIYLRHTATSWDQDDNVTAAGDWRSCDAQRMRQLSAEGRDMAKRIGAAMGALRIPVTKVLSSEYCRAAETARLLDIGQVTQTSDIVNLRSASYAGGDEAAVQRARRVLAQPPAAGGNAVIVGHGNLISAAAGVTAGEGGGAIFRPVSGSEGRFDIVARLDADDWEKLAAEFADTE